MRDDIDVRLHDYHEHSREFGHADRIPEGVSVAKPELPYPEPGTLPKPGAPGPALDWRLPVEPFPIGDET